jgi:succinate dehydrogenase / fumarate reductase flavoprotein subunit
MKIEKSEVLIIGSGGAGLRAAIELKDRGKDVLVVGKCEKRDAHTILATGGINAALGNMDPKDSWQLHAADTIRDGGFINDTDAVLLLCKNAPAAVKELDKWKAGFHREKNGKITQRFFGAATYRRACFIGDHTGREILNTLVDQVEKRKIRFQSEVYIFSLLFDSAKNKVYGALGLDIRSGEIIVFHAKAVVLCTGGHSRVYSRSSSRFWENTGDGIALAYRCGAKFMDMEMFQFHPTGMLSPREAEGVLVTEAVRGEGGILTNIKGERFMKRYDPERMELSARDIVARAIYEEVKEGRGTKRGGVFLDISHKPKSYILKRLPKMYEQFKHFAHIDISKEKMEVAPTAHYSMGGVFTDAQTGKTSVNGLYAIGEVTSGTHGANRLGGNSLAEIIVFGRLTGENISHTIDKIDWTALDMGYIDNQVSDLMSLARTSSGSARRDPIEVKKEIQRMMWKYAGVVRKGDELKRALKEIDKVKRVKLGVSGGLQMNEKLIAALDIRNMIPTCEMIVRSALYRRESRGAHYRDDFPKLNDKYKRNVICLPDSKGIRISTRAIKAVPSAVALLIKTTKKPKAHLVE